MSDYNLGTASGRIEVDGRAAALGFKTAETAASAFFSVLRNKVESVQTLGRRMAYVGTAGTVGFGTAVKVAADFEKQMSGVEAVVNGTADEIDSLRDKALQLGADTAFSASEAALAIEELAKAGIPVADILNGAAEGAVALAAAGGIGLQEAATIAANAMNAFEIPASKVVDVADTLAGVANKGAADVSSLGSSLSQAGAVANLAGLSLKDTAIALGELSDAGINGSDAGTSLKTMLNNLIPTTDKQIDKFKELGLLTEDLGEANKALAKEGLPVQKSMAGVIGVLEDYFDRIGKANKGTQASAKAIQDWMADTGAYRNAFFKQNGDIKNLAGLQGTLADATDEMTRKEKLATLEILFGADAMRASAIMAKEGAKGARDYNKALEGTSAADVAAKRLDNLAGATEALGGSLETAMITIGSVFLPVVTAIVKGVTAIVNAFNSLPKGIQVAIAILGAIASAGLLVIGMILAMLPLILAWVGNFLLMRVVGTVVASLRTFYTTIRAGQGVMVAGAAANARFATGMTTLGKRSLAAGKMTLLAGKMMRAAWLLATGPIGIAIAVIAAVVALGVALYKRWTPFRELMDSIGAAIKDKFLAAWAAVKPILLSVLGAVKTFGQFLASTLLPVLSAVGNVLLAKLFDGFDAIKEALSTTLLPAVRQLVSTFQSEMLPALQSAGGFLATVGGWFAKVGSIIGSFLLPMIMAIGRFFVTFVLPILIKVAGFFAGVFIDAIVGAVKGIIQAISGIIQIFTGLINFFKGVFTGNWSQAWEGIKQIFFGAIDLVVGALKAWFNIGILKFVGVGIRALWAILRGGLRFVFLIFKTQFNAIAAIVRFAWNLIRTIFTKGTSLVRGIVTRVFNVIRAIIRGVMNFVMGYIRFVWSILKAIFTRDGAALGKIMDKAGSAISKIAGKAMDFLRNAFQKGIEWVVNFMRDLPGKILNALGDLGRMLYDAGSKIVQGLLDGITSKIDDVKGAFNKLTGMIPDWKGPADVDKKLLEGNGQLIIGGLMKGLESQFPAVRKLLGTLTGEIGDFVSGPDGAKMLRALQNPAMAAARTGGASGTLADRPGRPSGVRRGGKGKGGKKMRFIDGEMDITPRGKARVTGWAIEADDDDDDYEDTLGRMRKP